MVGSYLPINIEITLTDSVSVPFYLGVLTNMIVQYFVAGVRPRASAFVLYEYQNVGRRGRPPITHLAINASLSTQGGFSCGGFDSITNIFIDLGD